MTETGGFFAAGKFGCAAKPGFKCAYPPNNERAEISKLMTQEEAYHEWKEIEKFKKRVAKIPQHENYFLLTKTTKCDTPIMYPSDFNNIKVCESVKFHHRKKRGDFGLIPEGPPISRNYIVQSNVGLVDKSDKLRFKTDPRYYFSSIQMQDGGTNVKEFLKTITTKEELSKLNAAIVELITNGIFPMNRKPVNIIHNDVKLDNLVFDGTHVRLIDWGLANVLYEQGYNLYPFVRNHPYYAIFFFDDFKMPEVLNTHDDGPIADQLLGLKENEDFINEIISYLTDEIVLKLTNLTSKDEIRELLIGNLKYILSKLFPDEEKPARDTDFLIQLSDHFPGDNYDRYSDLIATLSLYYDSIYTKNADIYGLILDYLLKLKELKDQGKFGFVEDTVIQSIFEKFILGREYFFKPYDINSIKTELFKLVPRPPQPLSIDTKPTVFQRCTPAMMNLGLCVVGAATAAATMYLGNGGKKTRKHRRRKNKSVRRNKKKTRRNPKTGNCKSK